MCVLSHIQLVATCWTVNRRALLTVGFPRQEYWSGLLCSPPGDLPNRGLNPGLLHLLHWQADSLPLSHLGLKILQCVSFVHRKCEHTAVADMSVSELTPLEACTSSWTQLLLSLCGQPYWPLSVENWPVSFWPWTPMPHCFLCFRISLSSTPSTPTYSPHTIWLLKWLSLCTLCVA